MKKGNHLDVSYEVQKAQMRASGAFAKFEAALNALAARVSAEEIAGLRVPKAERGGVSCAICMMEVVADEDEPDEDHPDDAEVLCLPCGHTFHESCVSPWFHRNSSCPNCRQDLASAPKMKMLGSNAIPKV